MAEKIIMPQGGQDLTEGRVVEWLKSEGDEVKKGEVICEVETEKAVFEVESPVDGVLLKIIVPAGQKAKVFSTIGLVGAAGEIVELEDEEDALEDKKISGIDVAALKKKVAVKGKGRRNRLMASFEDKNDDGLLDLMVHVNTQEMEISKSDKIAVLEGATYDNTPIIGSDSIRIVRISWKGERSIRRTPSSETSSEYVLISPSPCTAWPSPQQKNAPSRSQRT